MMYITKIFFLRIEILKFKLNSKPYWGLYIVKRFKMQLTWNLKSDWVENRTCALSPTSPLSPSFLLPPLPPLSFVSPTSPPLSFVSPTSLLLRFSYLPSPSFLQHPFSFVSPTSPPLFPSFILKDIYSKGDSMRGGGFSRTKL